MSRLLSLSLQSLPLASPFRISGYVMNDVATLLVAVSRDGATGTGEAAGVYYLDDEPAGMRETLEALRSEIEAGLDREALQTRLPRGGARNALDCALWELDARLAGVAVWQLAGLAPPRPLLTTFTLGADDPATMRASALGGVHAQARALKLKLTGDLDVDIERVRAVRAARPDVWIGVDANQGYTIDALDGLMPVLVDAGVGLLEQPLRRGSEADLEGFHSPVPLAADESALGVDDIAGLVGRFDVVNIKLDKCGGLTEGLLIAEEARRHGLKVMVGNMVGTGRAMAPAYLVGQACDVVDLDGPIFLRHDIDPTVVYADGLIHCDERVWGGAAR